MSYKILAQAVTNENINNPSLQYLVYTVPANKQVKCYIHVAALIQEIGPEAKQARYKLHVVKAGELPEPKNCIAFWQKIDGAQTNLFPSNGFVSMDEGDQIILYGINDYRISVQVRGEEIDDTVESLTKTFLQSMTTYANTAGPAIVAHSNKVVGCPCP